MGIRRMPCYGMLSALVAKSSPGHRKLSSNPFLLRIRYINLLFSAIFAASLVFLMRQWRQKICSSSPLHILSLPEIAAAALVGSFIFLLNIYGINFYQFTVSAYDEEEDEDSTSLLSPAVVPVAPGHLLVSDRDATAKITLSATDPDEAIVSSVVDGKTPSYILEAMLGDCRRAAGMRREAVRRLTRRDLGGLPLDGFDYSPILGQCCELPVGYVQLPVGIAGPLVLDGTEFYVPIATTEGCLVASTNRGCKAIAESGGAMSVVLKDGMTRAPAVWLPSAKRAAQMKAFWMTPTISSKCPADSPVSKASNVL